ncbi:SDR family NAD(P)-dependent oxidoreductase [Acinetobacter nosocomialis]|uniref:SDR family NAD(P)-dependent oxidoreductase n=1 Tax=Acinetobacter nosocomialis TaxID=106654 RepID=UPI003D6D6C57
MVKGLKNKVVLVTGAAQGIGRGIALRLAQEGAHIALVDMKQDRLNDVQQEIQTLGVNASTFIADVSDREQVYAAINHAEQTLGGFDVMINNAGIAQVQAIADSHPTNFKKLLILILAACCGAYRLLLQNLSSGNIKVKSLMLAQLQATTGLLYSVFTRQLNLRYEHLPKPRQKNMPVTVLR